MEKQKRKSVNMRLSEGAIEKLKWLSVHFGISQTAVIELAVRKLFRKEKKETIYE